jgi:hypothetical protein
MADLGMQHTHVNHYGSVPAKKPLSARGKLQLGIHAALLTAAFAFVAAFVFGLIG